MTASGARARTTLSSRSRSSFRAKGGRTKPGAPVASHTIAREHGIPERFLLKVLNPLVSAGILSSLKGPHGGYRLARTASDITLLEVIEAVEGTIRGEAPPPEPEDKEKYP